MRLVFFAGLLISTFILTVKFLQPVSIQLEVNGQRIEFTQQPIFYGLWDLALVTASAFTSGACLILLLTQGAITDKTSGLKIDFTSVKERVEDDDEKALVGILIDAGGSMFQSDLVERSGFSKGKVSLVLDRLEARGVIQRKRSGMTNLVVIKAA